MKDRASVDECCNPDIAYRWARSAARAARTVPVSGAEAAAWTVRGLADLATGCLALGLRSSGGPAGAGRLSSAGRAAILMLDEAVADANIARGGPHAARLRALRRLASPVPCWYPQQEGAGAVRPVGRTAWQAARLLTWFGGTLVASAAGLPIGVQCPTRTAAQLEWGAVYRPSPSEPDLTLPLPVSRKLARRSWMTLPREFGRRTAFLELPSVGSPMQQQVWRGIHEAAHLDHLAAVNQGGASPDGPPDGPVVAEYGIGLLAAESYAMAVELVAAVECLLAGDGGAVRQLGAGLAERAARLPGGAAPAADFADLPTWAEAYVVGPLALLADDPCGDERGGPLADALAGFAAQASTARLLGSLRLRWQAACGCYPPAAWLASAAGELLTSPADLRVRVMSSVPAV